MKFVDEFRDAGIINKTADEIRRLTDPERHYRLMEVCGGHTHAIYRFGLKDVLPKNIELIHGPGCPVCVLPMGRIDDGLSLGRDRNVIFTAFGDMMRVPGTKGTPLEYKARGYDVRMVYSPLDALRYGAPPHGGIAMGIDRIVTALAGVDTIRDTIAFPKAASGADPLTGAPAPVDPAQLRELGLRPA